MNQEPESLQEAIVYFSNPDNCIAYLAIRRWPNGLIMCPAVASEKVKFNANRRIWPCTIHHSKREFSIKVGTVMEDSAIPLDKWLTAAWMIANCKNGVSSYEIARDMKVTQKSAWFMLHRIRLRCRTRTLDPSSAERRSRSGRNFHRRKARNMHRDIHGRRITGMGQRDKTIVMGHLGAWRQSSHCRDPGRQKETLQPSFASTLNRELHSY